MSELDAVLLCVAGVSAIGLTLAAIRMYFNLQQQKHEREHLERMKGLELGMPVPAQHTAPTQASIMGLARFIGGFVPLGAFVSSAIASLAVGYHEAMWIATGLVGLGSVICGAVVASYVFCTTNAGSEDHTEAMTAYKPRVEDDAYDVVSARG